MWFWWLISWKSKGTHTHTQHHSGRFFEGLKKGVVNHNDSLIITLSSWGLISWGSDAFGGTLRFSWWLERIGGNVASPSAPTKHGWNQNEVISNHDKISKLDLKQSYIKFDFTKPCKWCTCDIRACQKVLTSAPKKTRSWGSEAESVSCWNGRSWHD